MIVYDAENQILGRLCTVIAKKLLQGETVFVVNAEKAILAGDPKFKKKFYLEKYHRGDPIHGPFFPKQPNEIFRRTVRGMLPWDRTRGREAFRRLKVFIGIPEELKNKQIEKLTEKKLKIKYITLGELSLHLGAKRRW